MASLVALAFHQEGPQASEELHLIQIEPNIKNQSIRRQICRLVNPTFVSDGRSLVEEVEASTVSCGFFMVGGLVGLGAGVGTCCFFA